MTGSFSTIFVQLNLHSHRLLHIMATESSLKPSLDESRAPPSSDVDLPSKNVDKETPEKTKYTWRFWAIFLSLSVTSLLAAVESTVTSTALPIISAELNAGERYIWFVNAYFLTR